MTKEQANNEMVYQLTMSAARKMLEKGLITRDEYVHFDTNMRAKLCPLFGIIFSDIDLL